MQPGTISAITGAAVEVTFDQGSLPPLATILIVSREGGRLLLEVEQQLDTDRVRCAPLGSVSGLQPGMTVANTGEPLQIPVGPSVCGRVLDLAGEPLDGAGAIGNAPRLAIHRFDLPLQRHTNEPPLLETGIKVIDLLAPIPRGGIVGLFGGAGVGKMVVVSELIQRIAAHYDGMAVFVGSEEHTYEVNDLMREMRDVGLAERVAMVFSRINDGPAAIRRTTLAGQTIAEYAREQGQEVLLFIDKALFAVADSPELRARVGATIGGAVTLVVFGPVTGETEPLDGQIICSRAVAAQQRWPAIDCFASTSQLLHSPALRVEHREVAQQVLLLLRDAHTVRSAYEHEGEHSLSAADRRVLELASRVELFLTQPFVVAEPYTDQPGAYVPLAETIRGFQDLLTGQHDDLPAEAFRFVGNIDQAKEKASFVAT